MFSCYLTYNELLTTYRITNHFSFQFPIRFLWEVEEINYSSTVKVFYVSHMTIQKLWILLMLIIAIHSIYRLCVIKYLLFVHSVIPYKVYFTLLTKQPFQPIAGRITEMT